MGDFRITVEAIGGHGCGRGTEVPYPSEPLGQIPGEDRGSLAGRLGITRCRRMDCPDCLAEEFVERLKRIGVSVFSAKLEHWPVPPAARSTDQTWVRPESERGPTDDLLTRTRDRAWR